MIKLELVAQVRSDFGIPQMCIDIVSPFHENEFITIAHQNLIHIPKGPQAELEIAARMLGKVFRDAGD